MTRSRLVRLGALLVLLLSTACRQVTPLPAEALADLRSVDDLRAWFNGERERPRLLVLLSPT